MSEVFDPSAKHDLVLGDKTLIGYHRGQTFLVVGHISGGILSHSSLQVIKVLRLTFGNSNLQLTPQIFDGITVWRLSRHFTLLASGRRSLYLL